MMGKSIGSCADLLRSHPWQIPPKEKGATLIVSLIMLIATLLLGIAASEIAVQGAKTSRNDRDREIAFQAAEAALVDAEMDIEQSPDPAKSRSHIFSKYSKLGFPDEGEPVCHQGGEHIYLGLCRSTNSSEGAEVWQHVDFSDADVSTVSTVAFGTFTGRVLQTGQGALPSRLPRYVIEQFAYNRAGESAERQTYFYRITAVGFGPRETTQVALQTFYSKAGE